MSCNSSPISFCAPLGKPYRFFFDDPIQTTGRIGGNSKSFKADLNPHIHNYSKFTIKINKTENDGSTIAL
jgi:hypothetical protein